MKRSGAIADRVLRSAGIRWRSALAAVLVTAVALATSMLFGVSTVRQGLSDSVSQALAARAGEVASQAHALDTDQLDRVTAAVPGRAGVVQILDSAGRVISGRVGSARTPIVELRLGPGETFVENHLTVQPFSYGDDGEVVAAAEGVLIGGEPHTVVVTESSDSIDSTAQTILSVLLSATPIFLLMVGALTYWLVGRALRSVEAIRTQVAGIGDGELSRRVPVPVVEDEVGLLARTMNGMLARLENARSAQRRFVADASHELRSPLSTLLASLELLEESAERESVHAIRAEALRMQALVDDLLFLTRADEQGVPMRWGEVDLDDLLDAERSRLRDTTGLAVHAELTPVKIFGDHRQLTRMLRNLVDNAARYAGSEVTLRLSVTSAEHAPDMATLRICDDGPGIPAHEHERVFERFVRLDEARDREAGGTGLGLPIAREIAHAHHARLTLGTAASGGARLQVDFRNL